MDRNKESNEIDESDTCIDYIFKSNKSSPYKNMAIISL